MALLLTVSEQFPIGSEKFLTGSELLAGLVNLQYSSGDLQQTFSKLQM